MKRLLLLICFTTTAFISHAQKAILIGKVTSARNESLIGVTITLKSDRNQVTKTDVEGRYSFTIDINKKYSNDTIYYALTTTDHGFYIFPKKFSILKYIVENMRFHD